MKNKKILVDLLKQLTKTQQNKFKELYGGKDCKNLTLLEIIKKLNDCDVMFAIVQAKKTIELNKDRIELKIKKLIDKCYES
jgi:tRNA(Ser,Leu) C12 N-acetylase TAN1